MRTRVLLPLLLALALAACGAPSPRPEVPVPARPVEAPQRQAPAAAGSGQVRLVTWNVRDLFDPVDDPYDDEVPTPREFEAKLQALGRVLVPLEPDLLALQEVENEAALAALARGPLAPLGMRWQVLVEGNDTGRGIDVAFLSRVDLAGHRSHARDALPSVPGTPRGYGFSRDCLEVHVGLPEPVVVLVNHFKSRAGSGSKSDPKRRAQSLGVVRIVEGLGQVPVAVVGDLNDRPDSWALAPLFSGGLADVLGALPEAGRATYVHKGRPEALDYILVNAALARRVVPGSARVVDGPEVRAASDHRPVVVDLYAGGGGGPPSPSGETGR